MYGDHIDFLAKNLHPVDSAPWGPKTIDILWGNKRENSTLVALFKVLFKYYNGKKIIKKTHRLILVSKGDYKNGLILVFQQYIPETEFIKFRA